MTSKIDGFANFLSSKIIELSEQREIAKDDAWPMVAADILGYDIDEIDFLTNRDQGIDFYVIGNSIYEIFQAKMHDLGEFDEPQHHIAYDEKGITDSKRAMRFLLESDQTPPNIDPRLLGLRARIKEDSATIKKETHATDKNIIKIIFHLITFGDNFVPQAEHSIKEFKSILNEFEKLNPFIELSFELQGLASLSEFHEDDLVEKRPEKITLQKATQQFGFKNPDNVTISTNKFVTFYASAVELVEAARLHGPRLFDANVRYELKKSAINQVIINSATHRKTIELFHLYNNGVTIAASRWAPKKNRQEIEIFEPSIINGCQTVRSLAEALKQLENQKDSKPDLLDTFHQKCSVLVRLVNNSSVNIEEIVRAANTQNAMEPRNLLSNQPEQRTIEDEFADCGWFYERKDGAKDALRETKRSAQGHQISKFQSTDPLSSSKKKILRSRSNTDVSSTWLSFIGYSDAGKNKRKLHFDDSRDGLYERIYLKTPKTHRLLIPENNQDQDFFKIGRPPSIWMLTANLVFKVVCYLMPTANLIRTELRKEIRESGREPRFTDINERIMTSDALRSSYALSMADHILLENIGYILAKSLGDAWLTPGPARKILNSGILEKVFRYDRIPETFQIAKLLSLSKENISQDPILLALRLAAHGFEKTLSDPIVKRAFSLSERKSRFVQSEAMLKTYPKTIDEYEAHFSKPATFSEWWDGGSIYKHIKELLY